MGIIRGCILIALVYSSQALGELGDYCNGKPAGTYPHPWGCSEYIVCNNGITAVQRCPAGLWFDHSRQICDFQHNVNCGVGGMTPLEPKQASSMPTAPISHSVSRAVPTEVMITWTPTVYRTPVAHGTSAVHQTPKVQRPAVVDTSHNRPSMVDTVHSEVPDPAKAQIVFSGITDANAVCGADGYYADSTDCSHYILCVQGQRYRRLCPRGTYYDPATNACGYDPEACRSSPALRDSVLNNQHAQVTTAPRQPELEQTKHPSSIFPAGIEADEWTEIEQALQGALQEAHELTSTYMQQEAQKARSSVGAHNPFNAVGGFLGATPYVKQISIPASQQLEALKFVKDRYNLDNLDIFELMNRVQYILQPNPMMTGPDMISPTPTMGVCPYAQNNQQNFCDRSTRYRTADGSCNNMNRPLWGKSFRPLQRFLEPDYADGISQPRISRAGTALPSARQLTSTMHEDRNRPSHVHTLFVMTFGQMIDHDMTRTAVTMLNTNEDGSGQKVEVSCGSDGCQTEGVENRACLPITVPQGDKDFPDKSCLMFVRTQEVPADNCKLGPREQLNQLTSYLDASMVYGSTLAASNHLRDLQHPGRGRLRLRANADPHLRPMLPVGTEEELGDECTDQTPKLKCFLAGDTRVNEQVGLAALHTIFHRYHNVLEAKLHALNPVWGGERLFQETRRIVGAMWQHMIYNEWLPVVMGQQAQRQYGLELEKRGFYNAYDSSVNVEVSNVFATAAFRFAHSMIDNLVSLASNKYNEEKYRDLSTVLRRPYDLYDNTSPAKSGVDSVLFGQISHPCQSVDRFFSQQITSRLFSEDPPNKPGTDLPALNIQRGREHGIPGYNNWREWCGLPRARSFDELTDIAPEARDMFSKVYDHVDDIDIFPGGIAERLVPGGTMGPTFACIIGRQFRNSRVADRFWYERNDPTTGFTIDQLNEIRKITVARVMCDTMDSVVKVQKYVMLQPMSEAIKKLGEHNIPEIYNLAGVYRGDNNERRSCKDISQVDLSVFRE